MLQVMFAATYLVQGKIGYIGIRIYFARLILWSTTGFNVMVCIGTNMLDSLSLNSVLVFQCFSSITSP